MDHENLEIKEVKEIEEVRELVGASALHRPGSALTDALSAHTFSAGIRMGRLRFRLKLPSSARKSLDNADSPPRG
jgi:hypothetical protein